MSNNQIKLKPTLYLSFDIETDGNNPLLHSMISIGFCGMTDGFKCMFEYSANILPLDEHVQESLCMKFWEQNKSAWNATQINQKHYTIVMAELSNHFIELAKLYNLKFIAMPSCFDWMFFKSYYEMAQMKSATQFYNIGYSCICISSYFNSYCDSQNMCSKDKEILKLQLMKHDKSLEHLAIEDARCQARLFVGVRQLLINPFVD